MDYRLYLVGANGHFTQAIAIDAPDDEAAIVIADEYANGSPMELWKQGRKVRMFAASGRGEQRG